MGDSPPSNSGLLGQGASFSRQNCSPTRSGLLAALTFTLPPASRLAAEKRFRDQQHARVFWIGLDGEAQPANQAQHRFVLGQHLAPDLTDAASPAVLDDLLQQQTAEALPLQVGTNG